MSISIRERVSRRARRSPRTMVLFMGDLEKWEREDEELGVFEDDYQAISWDEVVKGDYLLVTENAWPFPSEFTMAYVVVKVDQTSTDPESGETVYAVKDASGYSESYVGTEHLSDQFIFPIRSL